MLVKKLGISVEISDIFPWRTIESAPKDGGSIIIWDGMDAYQSKWHLDFGDWSIPLPDTRGYSIGGRRVFTHWMPLPTPPEEQK